MRAPCRTRMQLLRYPERTLAPASCASADRDQRGARRITGQMAGETAGGSRSRPLCRVSLRVPLPGRSCHIAFTIPVHRDAGGNLVCGVRVRRHGTGADVTGDASGAVVGRVWWGWVVLRGEFSCGFPVGLPVLGCFAGLRFA
jgi:hypothetical protein